jgi:hypothetical protein
LRKVYDGPALPLWTLVEVETYCGVKIKCEIVEVRRLSSGVAYTVKPRENKEEELRKAGVPKGDWQSYFTAFDWQIKSEQPTLPVQKTKQPQSQVIRRSPRKGEGYVST